MIPESKLAQYILSDHMIVSKRHHTANGSVLIIPTVVKTAFKIPSVPSPSNNKLKPPKVEIKNYNHDRKNRTADSHHHHTASTKKSVISMSSAYSGGTKLSTVDPTPHASHDSYEKHVKEALRSVDSNKLKLVFIGDSCLSQLNRDSSIRELIYKYHPVNLASPGFRTEHMLYRLTTSNVHKIFIAPVFVVMIGTFNIGIHDAAEATRDGIVAIVQYIRKFSLETARVVVCSILPRQSVSLNAKIDKTNQMVQEMVQMIDRVHFLHLDNLFKGDPYPEELLNDEMYMPDHLHPSEKGYHAIVNLLKIFMLQFDDAIDASQGLIGSELNITKTIVDTLI